LWLALTGWGIVITVRREPAAARVGLARRYSSISIEPALFTK